MKTLFILMIFALSANFSLAETITTGKPLPSLAIADKGLLLLHDKEAHYRPWLSETLKGQRLVIQYISARLKPGRMNIELNDRLRAIDHPQRCRTISIINVDDAIWGTRAFVEPELISNQKKTPKCQIIYDSAGIGLNTWGLEAKGNATIVINEQGIVEFFHEGKLSSEQMDEIIRLSTPIAQVATHTP